MIADGFALIFVALFSVARGVTTIRGWSVELGVFNVSILD